MFRGLVAAVVIAGSAVAPAAAQWQTPWRDHDRAREGMEKCRAMPYPMIRRDVEQQYGGRIVGQDFAERKCAYRLQLVRPDGQVLSVLVDAQSGAVMAVVGGER